MSSPPLVSVVIPTYNRKLLLVEAIASVQAQSFRDLEVLVCDDGSTDGSEQAVRALAERDPRIRWIAGEHCGFPGRVRNRGAAAAKGEWIAFQDSDDLWKPEKLDRQLELARRTPDAQFIHSYAAALLPDGSTHRMAPIRIPREGRIFETLLLYNFMATPTVLVKRSLLHRAGGFDEHMNLTVAEDHELYMRLAAEVPFHFIPEDLVLCRQQAHGASADVLGGLDQIERVLQAAIRRFRVPEALAGLALAKIDLRRYKHHLLQRFPRNQRLRDLQSALGRDARNRMARALMIAERMRCAPVVRTYVRLVENSAIKTY